MSDWSIVFVYAIERRRKQSVFRHSASADRWNATFDSFFDQCSSWPREKLNRSKKKRAQSNGWPDRFIAASAGAAFSFSSLVPTVRRPLRLIRDLCRDEDTIIHVGLTNRPRGRRVLSRMIWNKYIYIYIQFIQIYLR